MPVSLRTQVGIVGAGPAGLVLSHLLYLQGIDSVVIENRSRQYVRAARSRRACWSKGTVDLLTQMGVGERMKSRRLGPLMESSCASEGAVTASIFRISPVEKASRFTAQHEVLKDLNNARVAAGGQVLFEVENVSVHDLGGSEPKIRYQKDGNICELICDFIAGCDGFHGICRPSIPSGSAHRVCAGVSLRMAWHPGRSAAFL
jgi:p-hydroxybenzoate 3-monooxygenase